MTRTTEPTERELEVLRAVTEPGATQDTAAAALSISPHTVKATLARLYLKLDVHTAAQAWRVIHEREAA